MRFLLALLLVLGSPHAFAIDLDGRTEYAKRLVLNSSISARVESIYVSAGQRVERDQLLLRFGTTDLQAQVDMARAEADALAPKLARMLTELEKAQELFDRDSLALVELQHAEQDHAIAQAQLQAAEARLTRAEHRLSEAEIRAPIDGVVLTVEATVGQYINTRVSDQTLLTLADTDSMLAVALLPLELWSDDLLHRAAKVSFRDQTYAGKVIGLDRQITIGSNNHPAIVVTVKFETDGGIPAGLPVKIAIADD